MAQGFGKWSDYHVDDFTCRPGMLRKKGKSSMNEETILRNKEVLCVAEGNKLQRTNSGFIQHTPHEAQYTS